MTVADRYRSRVLVSIPTYRTPSGLLNRAVESVLAQIHDNLQVVVIVDGEKLTEKLPKDDRLVVFQLGKNYGTYFAQSVSLAASPYGWYAPHGSDDWCDPQHLERLLAMRFPAVAAGAVWWHQEGKPPRVHRANYEVGIYQTRRLQEIGGYNPTERMGQDSMTLKLLRHTGGFHTTRGMPTYHRVRRPGSLTTAPETKFGSLARNEMRERNRSIFSEVSKTTDLRRIREIRSSHIPNSIQDQVLSYAQKLKGQLG